MLIVEKAVEPNILGTELGLGPSHPLEGKGPVGAVLQRSGHEDAEDEGLGQLEVPSKNVGLILEILDNAENPLFRGGRDASPPVQDTVDRADGDAGQLGDCLDCADSLLLAWARNDNLDISVISAQKSRKLQIFLDNRMDLFL